VEKWTTIEVHSFLSHLGDEDPWQRYADRMLKREVTGKQLQSMSSKELQEFGLEESHANSVLDAIAKLSCIELKNFMQDQKGSAELPELLAQCEEKLKYALKDIAHDIEKMKLEKLEIELRRLLKQNDKKGSELRLQLLEQSSEIRSTLLSALKVVETIETIQTKPVKSVK